MEKTSIIVSCPIDTYSGYGARSRDFVKALLALKKYDVKVLGQRWGNTRFGYLEDHNEEELQSILIPNLTSKPDVWIQITVPNEFQKIGTYNIGVTAGIETTLVDPKWIEGVNRMDLVLTSSKHSANVFSNSKYNIEHKDSNALAGKLEVTTPVEVLFEGADISKYFPIKGKLPVTEISNTLDSINESFCFLFVGHWLQGDFSEDRKNVGYLVKSFLETFKNKRNSPALILKTSRSTTSISDREAVLDKIEDIRKTVKGSLPNIYLLHGDVTDEEMNILYNHTKVKAMVCLTKGEGFGRPLLEFSLTNKPIIASGWSGQIDFLDRELSILIGGELKKVHPSAVVNNVILAESMWFSPDDEQVGKAYKTVIKDYKKYTTNAVKLGYRNRTQFTLGKMTEALEEIFNTRLPEFPKQVTLNLPKLQKIN